ncbi:MAG TPA: hypothetical protein VIJ99_10430 [Acidimicrobiales bacterium]
MSYHVFTVEMGWLAVLSGVVGTATQLRRVGTRGVEGVSLATWVLFVYMGCFWITYGFAARSTEVVLGSALILPMQLAILVRLKPWRRVAVALRALGYFVLCCVVPTLVWGWAGGVLGTGVAMTINRAPQLIELVRYADASGVSATSWFIGAFGCTLWILYYTGAHLWAALTATAFAGVANLSIGLLATWRHAQADESLVIREAFAT